MQLKLDVTVVRAARGVMLFGGLLIVACLAVAVALVLTAGYEFMV